MRLVVTFSSSFVTQPVIASLLVASTVPTRLRIRLGASITRGRRAAV